MVINDCRLQALKEKIADQKKHLDDLDANLYVDPFAACWLRRVWAFELVGRRVLI